MYHYKEWEVHICLQKIANICTSVSLSWLHAKCHNRCEMTSLQYTWLCIGIVQIFYEVLLKSCNFVHLIYQIKFHSILLTFVWSLLVYWEVYLLLYETLCTDVLSNKIKACFSSLHFYCFGWHVSVHYWHQMKYDKINISNLMISMIWNFTIRPFSILSVSIIWWKTYQPNT